MCGTKLGEKKADTLVRTNMGERVAGWAHPDNYSKNWSIPENLRPLLGVLLK